MTPDGIRWHFAQAVEMEREQAKALGLTPGGGAAIPAEPTPTAAFHAAGILGRRRPNAPKGGPDGR